MRASSLVICVAGSLVFVALSVAPIPFFIIADRLIVDDV